MNNYVMYHRLIQQTHSIQISIKSIKEILTLN